MNDPNVEALVMALRPYLVKTYNAVVEATKALLEPARPRTGPVSSRDPWEDWTQAMGAHDAAVISAVLQIMAPTPPVINLRGDISAEDVERFRTELDEAIRTAKATEMEIIPLQDARHDRVPAEQLASFMESADTLPLLMESVGVWKQLEDMKVGPDRPAVVRAHQMMTGQSDLPTGFPAGLSTVDAARTFILANAIRNGSTS